MQIARRMEPLKGVLVMEMNMRLAKMKQEGKDVINLGVGDPDFNPPGPLLNVLQEAIGHLDYHHYPSFYPQQPLKDAIASWYKRRFHVDLDPGREVLPLLGSTDGLFMVHLCLLDSGDLALVPDPSYPSYEAGVQVTGGGSGTGIAALINGATDICQSSRPLGEKERGQIRAKFGRDPVEIPVAMDGLAVFVHESNPLKTVTLAQLRAVYTGKVRSWGELGTVVE